MYNYNLEKENYRFFATGGYRGYNLKRFINTKERYNIYENEAYSNWHNTEYNAMTEFLSARDKKIVVMDNKYCIVDSFNTIISVCDELPDLCGELGADYNNNYSLTGLPDDEAKLLLLTKREDENSFATLGLSYGTTKYDNKNVIFDYEVQYHIFAPREKIVKDIRKGLLKKIKTDYIQRERNKVTVNDLYYALLLTKEDKITLQDSKEVGNCEYGSINFANKYNLKIETVCSQNCDELECVNREPGYKCSQETKYILIKDIIDHPQRLEMFKNNNFKNLIYNKFINKCEG
jgi:hypothetical protein